MEISKIREYAIQDFDDNREIDNLENFLEVYEIDNPSKEDYKVYRKYLSIFNNLELAMRTDVICMPAIFRPCYRTMNEVLARYGEKSNLDYCEIQKWYPIQEKEYLGVVMQIWTSTSNTTLFRICEYQNPGKIKKDNPIVISTKASIEEIDKYVDMLITNRNAYIARLNSHSSN